MKNNLQEEIKRYKQLSGYNPKLTLTENVLSEDSQAIKALEQTLGKDIQTIFKDNEFGTAIRDVAELKNVLNMSEKNWVAKVKDAVREDGGIVGGKLSSELERAGILRDIQKNIKAEKRALAATETETIASNSIKNTKKVEAQAAKELKSVEGGGTTAQGARDINVKGGNQTMDVGGIKVEVHNYPPATKVTPEGGSVVMEGKNVAVPEASKEIKANSPIGQRIRNMVKKGWSYRKIIWTLAKLGIGAWLIWYFFFKEKEVPADTDKTQPKPEDGGGSGGGGSTTPTGNYTQCSETFPIRQYCKNETIKQIQSCIGVVPDGKFGPKTQAALESLGLPGTEITQDTLNRACGSSSQSSESNRQKPMTADYYNDYQTDETETSVNNGNTYSDYGNVEGSDESTPTQPNSPIANKKSFYPNPEEEI